MSENEAGTPEMQPIGPVAGVAPEMSSESSTAGAEGGAAEKSTDYIGRIESEPKFASKEIREKDRFITKLQEKVSKFSPLEKYVEAVGAAEVEEYIRQGVLVRQNPTLNGIIEEFNRTGQLPSAKQAAPEMEDDPYEDPGVKTLRHELRELKASNEALQRESTQRFALAETRSLQEGVSGNVKSFMDKYAVNDDLRNRLSSTIQQRVDEARNRAERGDAQALQMLNMLHGKQGIETLQRIAAPILLEDDTQEAIAGARRTARVKPLAAQSTGAPSRAPATTPKKGLPASVTHGPDYVRQTLEQITRDAGLDPNTTWSRG